MGDKASKTKRTKRLLKIFLTGIAVGLVIVELLSLVWGPASRNERSFAKHMKELSAMADGSEVMLTDITPFSWEAVYSFDPYMTKAEMEKILGFQSRNLEETVSEGMVQLVFIDGQKVVCCISGYSKSLGYSVDLGQWNDGNPYRRIDAGLDRFILEKESGIPSLLFLGEEFEGAVEEVYPEGAVIKIDDGWEIRSSGDRVTIRLSEEQWKAVEIGDRVRVTYDGMVMETYPLQLGRHQVKRLLAKPGISDESTIDFEEREFDNISRVKITSAHTGKSVFLREQNEIDRIFAFLSEVKGKDRMSAKGYYEGTYSVELFSDDTDTPIFSIGFGDQSTFYFGQNEEDAGYLNRYHLDGMSVDEVTAFFGRYLLLN